MRRVVLITLAAMAAIALIFGIFSYMQVSDQRLSLASDLQYRTHVLSDSLEESVAPPVVSHSTSTVERIVNRIDDNQRVVGLAVYDSGGVLVARSDGLTVQISPTSVANAMDADEFAGAFVNDKGGSRYVFVQPLHSSGHIVGALAIVQNSQYINDTIAKIWRDNLLRLAVQMLFIGLVVFALVWLVFSRTIKQIATSMQSLREGRSDGEIPHGDTFFMPLTGEIRRVAASLRHARHVASEEARMRFEELDSPWTAERLKEFIKAYAKNRPIYVLSNREPYVHNKVKNKVEWSVPAGGVITALEPVMEACGGVWIAHGSGSADKESADENGYIAVPPDEPRYTLKRIWLDEEEIKGYYTGFSNEAIWPLSHMVHTRPLFRAEDWREYKRVNAKFAKALLDEIKDVERPLVLVQDYHLTLAPEIIKKARPDALVSLFWHIPWPSAAQFNICPWRKEILLGMLGADLVGFHTQQYCNNFIDTVSNEVESRVDFDQFAIYRGDHRTLIKPFPISIAFPGAAEGGDTTNAAILSDLGIRSKYLLLGVDRLDYTKGLMERFKGIEFLLEMYPKYRENVTMLQIASPTRETVEKYREYADEVTQEAERINKKFGTHAWKPIVLEKRNYSHKELLSLYRLAHACIITSLHDGMNLVAKEYAAARSDETGSLILSQFAGASRDLKGALVINPYSAEETASAIHRALAMPLSEQHRHIKAMRESVRNYNIYRWSAEFIKTLLQLE